MATRRNFLKMFASAVGAALLPFGFRRSSRAEVISLTEIAEAIATVGPLAASLGLSPEETEAVLAKFSDANLLEVPEFFDDKVRDVHCYEGRYDGPYRAVGSIELGPNFLS